MQNGLFFTLASSEMVSGGDAEAGVGHPPQEEVADLQRQVCPFAVHDISNMKLLQRYTLNGEPSAAHLERIVYENSVTRVKRKTK
jgi:hypothetical protein